ncbi:MAG: hypothetical protein H7Z12_08350 [Rhodospirillaceae bacterium]|nr:hypothetical protein [Rhodospirillales bacterium]
MTTLKEILTQCYGYRRGDFGATGLVRVDCEEGTISPVPLQDIFTPHTVSPAKVVRLAAVFCAAQGVTLKGIGREKTRSFKVLMVSGDGLMVETPSAAHEFLPWHALRHALLRPELMVFDGPEQPTCRMPKKPSETGAARAG